MAIKKLPPREIPPEDISPPSSSRVTVVPIEQ